MPLTCPSSCARVTALPGAYCGTYFPSGSESASFPCSFNCKIAAAVNCLVIEPISNRVCTSTGAFVPISRTPKPLSNVTVPSRMTATAAPGARLAFTALSTASVRGSAACAPADAGMPIKAASIHAAARAISFMRECPFTVAKIPARRRATHSGDFEKPRRPHSSADAHRADHVFCAALASFDQRMHGHARAGEPVGVTDRYRAAAHVEAIVRNSERIPNVNRLHRERFVQLPQTDIVYAQSMMFEQFWNRVHGRNAHLSGLVPDDYHAAIKPKRLQATLPGEFRVHHDDGARAVGELRRIPGRNRRVRIQHAFQLRKGFERGVRAISFVLRKRNLFFAHLTRVFVFDVFPGRERNDFVVERAALLRRRRALLALKRVFVLTLARNVVFASDEVGSLQHRRVDVGLMPQHPLLGEELDVHGILHHADRFGD